MRASRGSGLRRSAVAVAVVCVLAAAAPAAHGGDNFFVGATDDLFKSEPGLAGSVAADLGLEAAAVSIRWERGSTTLPDHEVRGLDNAVRSGLRVVVAGWGVWWSAPTNAAENDAYCAYLADVLRRYPQINDIVVWNEPNLSFFWRPQFDAEGNSAAPAAYAELLARCYDVLHAVRPGVNVIGPATSPWGYDDPKAISGTISHSPTEFVRQMAVAYRASGRARPLFDTFAHHPYGERASERPWRKHASVNRVAIGDLYRLLEVLQEWFRGTAQPVPGIPANGKTAAVWYLETGFETSLDPGKEYAYTNSQPYPVIPDFTGEPAWTVLPDGTSPAPDQATQLRDAVRLSYCQPHVDAFFNFLLRDEPSLTAWQSGVLWADRTRKDSYGAFRDVIAEVRARDVDCTLFGLPAKPRPVAAPVVTTPAPSGSHSSAASGPTPATPEVTSNRLVAVAKAASAETKLLPDVEQIKWRPRRAIVAARRIAWRLARRVVVRDAR